MKRKLAIISCILLLLCLGISSVYAKEFPDVPSDHWALKYISELSDKGIINGYDDGTFKPNGTIKRGEFIKLAMAEVWPAGVELFEVPSSIDHWAGPYVGLAETYNIIKNGAINLENIEQPITRIEMVEIISNADIVMKQNKSQFSQEVDFEDVGDLSIDKIYLLSHAVKRGLVTGYDDGTFKPDKTMTRAEAATMIWRFSSKEGAK